MSAYATAIPTTAAMLAIGAGPLVAAADALLKKKHEAMSAHWDEMLAACASGAQADKYAARWLKRQRVALASGKLCRERAEALERSGLVGSAGDVGALASVEDERSAFTFSPGPAGRLAAALLCAAVPFVLAAGGRPIETVAAGCALGLVLAAVVICDMRARVIPYQTCIAYGAVAALWVAMERGPLDLLPSAALCVAAAAILAAAEQTAVKVTLASAVGAGDRRLIPLICLQVGLPGLLPGLAALCAVAGAMALAALARGAGKRSYLPFAPALYAFAAVGTVWPTLSVLF